MFFIDDNYWGVASREIKQNPRTNLLILSQRGCMLQYSHKAGGTQSLAHARNYVDCFPARSNGANRANLFLHQPSADSCFNISPSPSGLSRVLMPFGHRTPRKRDSCFNISPSPSGFFSVSRKVLRTQRTRRTRRSQRTLFDGLIVPHGKTIKERLRV